MKVFKHLYLLFRVLGLYVTAPIVFLGFFMSCYAVNMMGIAVFGVLSIMWIRVARFRYHVKYGWV